MKQTILVASLVIVACTTPPASSPAPPPSSPPTPPPSASPTPRPSPARVAWTQDLDALERHLGQHYANLEWNAAARKLDLAALDRHARAALQAARTDGEATEALARFVSAFRDAHLTWSAPLPSTEYDLRFTSDGHKVAVRIVGPNPCGLKPGDEIATIEGKPALEQLAQRLPLSGFANEELRRDIALRTLTASPFAPRERLSFEVRRGSEAVPCTVVPRTAAAKPAARPPGPMTSGEAACAAFGIVPTAPPTLPFLFQPERHASLRPHDVAESDLASGVVRLASGRTLGWLRIPLFSTAAYPIACARAWTQFRSRVAQACDDACRDDFVDHVLPRFLVETVAARLAELKRAGVAATVIDITDNGGGDDWVTDVVRMMSARPLQCPATAVVRDAAAVDRLERELADQATCDSLPLDAPARDAVTAHRTWTQQVRADAAQPCDLSGLFRGEHPDCTLLTRSRRAPCDRATAPPSVAALPERCTVLQPRRAAPPPRALVPGPVYVLVNRRTGSAAEAFAAILRDNGQATLIGETTVGAGCGYIDGGSAITLAQSGMTVRMPNCARFRADGTNEVDGLAPDVAVPWTVDDLTRFESYAEKLLAGADSWLAPRRR